MKKKKKKNDSGIALPLAVMMVIILALIGVGLIQLGRNARMQAVRDVLHVSARGAADAGMERAVRSMVNWWVNSSERSYDEINGHLGDGGISYGPIELTETYGDASFSYTISLPANNVGIGDITSTGTTGNATKVIHAKLGLFSQWESIGVKDSIDIGVGGGLYTLPLNGDFTIQTNSTDSPPDGGIVLRNGLNVPGDIYIGPGGDTDEVVVEKHNVVITGSTDDAPEYMDFPSFFPPSDLDELIFEDPNATGVWIISEDGYIPVALNVALSGDDPVTIRIEGNNGFEVDLSGNLILDDNGDPLVVPLNVFIDGDTILASGSTLFITEGSAVNIYLGGSLEAKVGSIITYEGLPEGVDIDPVLHEDLIVEAARSLTIFGTDDCDSIILKNSTDFFGKINAPEAYLEIRNSGDFYGAIMGSADLKMFNSGDFYFVSQLYEYLQVETLFMGILPGSWWEE